MGGGGMHGGQVMEEAVELRVVVAGVGGGLLSLLGQFVIPFVSARISDVSGILIHR